MPMNQSAWLLLLSLLATAAATTAATLYVIRVLKRRAILDRPNERSSHTVPTPRGGGWGVTPVVLIAWIGLAFLEPADTDFVPMLTSSAAILAAVCWWDDLRDLPALVRFFVQILAVSVGLSALSSDALVFQDLFPLWLDRFAAGFAWLWFLNLFNFMDGIDGITGTELATVGAALATTILLSGLTPGLAPYALVLAGAGLGFLVWNWHPAKVFLGDVGSVPLGYLTGWLLIASAAAGLWLPALILPLYYLADATITICRRLLRGEKIWRPHREHFYQQAVRKGLNHAQAVGQILVCNLVLAGAALASLTVGAWALIPAVTAVLILIWRLATPASPERLERA